jgi:Tol biopolymer transport system component
VTSTLFAIDLDGHERPLASSAGFTEIHDVAPDGRALIAFVSNRRSISCLPPGGTEEIDLSWLESTTPTDLSADGRTLLFTGNQDQLTFFLRNTDGSPPVRLGEGLSTTLSPDGKWALAAHQSGLLAVPTGTGESRILAAGKFSRIDWADWFTDGRRILISAAEPGRRLRLYAIEAAGGDPEPIGPDGYAMQPMSRSIAPDGSTLAAIDPEGRPVLLDLGGGDPRPIPGLESGDRIVRWTADGRALYVVASGNLPAPIFRVDVRSGERVFWKELRPREQSGSTTQPWVVMTPDGRSYAYSFQQTLSGLYLVTGLK